MITTKLNKTTKKASRWINEYFNSSCYSVSDFYITNVSRKKYIENAIKRRLHVDNLIGYKVINGNTFYFTCGFMTADKKTLFIETASRIYVIEL